MRIYAFLGAAAVAVALPGGPGVMAAALDDVRGRGAVNCGVSSGLAGFSAPDVNGVWQGFDVALCRAVAAAVLGDPMKVNFVPTTGSTRFTQLASGQIDLLARGTVWTFTHDVALNFTFAGVSYYDGQGFMVRRDLGVASAKELDDFRICAQAGMTTTQNLADFFRSNSQSYEVLEHETHASALQQYQAGSCEVFSADISALASSHASFADAEDHVILSDIISKEPLGPVVRHGDDQWADIVRWVLNALIAAEEHGVTSANIEELAKGTRNPEVNRLLGTEGDLGAMFSLDAQWARRAIAAGGNYGEIFAATIGEATPIGLARGLNAQWTQGGLLYAPPFR